MGSRLLNKFGVYSNMSTFPGKVYTYILFLNNFQFHICFFNFYEELVSSANVHAYRASQGVGGGEEKKCISELFPRPLFRR